MTRSLSRRIKKLETQRKAATVDDGIDWVQMTLDRVDGRPLVGPKESKEASPEIEALGGSLRLLFPEPDPPRSAER